MAQPLLTEKGESRSLTVASFSVQILYWIFQVFSDVVKRILNPPARASANLLNIFLLNMIFSTPAVRFACFFIAATGRAAAEPPHTEKEPLRTEKGVRRH